MYKVDYGVSPVEVEVEGSVDVLVSCELKYFPLEKVQTFLQIQTKGNLLAGGVSGLSKVKQCTPA